MNIKIEPIVDEFFKTIEASDATREVYLHALSHYSKFNNMSMELLLEEAETDMMEKIVPRKQRLIHRLVDFNDMMIKKYSSNTKGLYMGAVKSFYRTYGIIIPRIGKSKRKNLIKIENQWKGFDRDEVSRHGKATITLRDRALILLISTSGLSKKEIRNLLRNDFEKNQDSDSVTTFRVRREKTGFDFYTFCTPETTRAIYDYLKTRKDDSPYLFVSRNKTKISVPGWTWIFQNLNKRLGIDRKDFQFSQTRSHNYRKYFQSTLQNNSCPLWAVDFMMAHDTGEVRKHYHLADPDKLRDIYKEYMHLLAIDDRSFELMKDDEMKNIRTENKKQAAEIYNLKKDNEELNEKYDKTADYLFEVTGNFEKAYNDIELKVTKKLYDAILRGEFFTDNNDEVLRSSEVSP